VAYPAVHLNEDSMREGMQIESAEISVKDKIRLIDALSSTGLEQIEVGSFVSPSYTPSMARIDEVVAGFTPVPGVRYTALALNERGGERRAAYMPPLEFAPGAPALFTHLCDTFARRNTNRSRAEELAGWPAIIEAARTSQATEAGLGLGAAWGSNFEGAFTLAQRMAVLAEQHACWDAAGIPVTWVLLADPMSWCMPDVVETQLLALMQTWPGIRNIHLHLHDARGMALPSIYAALRVLDERFALYLDVTAGGIGGCPYCGNGQATGMAPTEDVVHMLESMGIRTGVDLGKLIEAVWLLEEILGRPTMGHVSKAGPRPLYPADFYDPNLPLVQTYGQARHFLLGSAVAEGGQRPWRVPIPAPAAAGHGG
jgi:hydroxymethylglutaryl-CoA lyase